MSAPDTYIKREKYSLQKLNKLKNKLVSLSELKDLPTLTIFGAGSYARLEASEFSDIDLFLISDGKENDIIEPNTKSLKLFGKIIKVVDDMNFPKLSNDCEYLSILYTKDILDNLGNRTDDHANYFTARMLLLLESHCLYGENTFNKITLDIVKSYFKDYPDHKQTFEPMFLQNDICRFWKTLLLNYENKRNLPLGGKESKRTTKQKVRNFKLKYSRMTTCFATIAALGSHLPPVNEEQVLALTKLTPRQRLESIPERLPKTKQHVKKVLDSYKWFLEMTGLPTEELEKHFSNKKKRLEMFGKANEYGNLMFDLITEIDSSDLKLKLLRNLVI